MAPRRTASASNAAASNAPTTATIPKPEPKAWTPPTTKKTDLERSISRIGATVPDSLKHDFDDSMKPGRRAAGCIIAKIMKEAEERERKCELMGVPEEKQAKSCSSYFVDQVARDLDIPYHTVGMPEFEEWNRRGFKMDPKLWEEKPSEEEHDRLFTLMVGSAFRE